MQIDGWMYTYMEPKSAKCKNRSQKISKENQIELVLSRTFEIINEATIASWSGYPLSTVQECRF